ncbi:MAG: VIT family protein, partial [Nostocoides sp.]
MPGHADESAEPSGDRAHPSEPHEDSHAARLNRLRAGVLGANDGIVSTSGIVIGVAAASPTNTAAIFTAGIAGLVAGALSMAAGEYVSVSTQRDTERALLAKEHHELASEPAAELEELTQLYQAKGLDRGLAEQVAVQLTDHDALAAHAEVELNLDPQDLTNPWQAAFASMLAFTIGAAGPLLSIVLLAPNLRIPLTLVAGVLVLAGTGWLSARLGDAPP